MNTQRPITTLLVAATFACSGSDNGPSQPSDGGNGGNGGNTASVSIVNNAFDPNSISVPVNGTVTWQWNAGGVEHNVTFQDAAPGSGNRSTGTFSRTFATAGTFPYLCTIHAAQGMTGTVTVTAGTTGGGGGGGGSGGGGGGAYP